MSVLIRSASFNDAPVLLSIIKQAFEQYRGRIDPPSSAMSKTLDVVLEEMSAADVLMAVDGGVPVGCIFFKLRTGVIYWDRLSVLPGHRKQGIATRLIEAVEQDAGRRGISRLQLEVRLNLAYLHDFYEKLGYGVLGSGSHPGFTQPTFLLMEKEIRHQLR